MRHTRVNAAELNIDVDRVYLHGLVIGACRPMLSLVEFQALG
jgi:hypothetical protein